MKISSTILTLVLVFSVPLIAQKSVPTQPQLESGTIESQFDYIITKSSSFKDFQLIRKSSILKVKSNALDSLVALRKLSLNSSAEIKGLNTQINQLKKEIVTLQEELKALKEEKDSIALFGNQIEKGLYNTILWAIIIVLLVALIFFVIRFKSNLSSVKNVKRELESLEREYEEHRKKALKKEQEIMRKLQDEINKNNP